MTNLYVSVTSIYSLVTIKNSAKKKGQEVSLLNSFKCKVAEADNKFKAKPESFSDAALTVKQVETVCDDVIAAMEII